VVWFEERKMDETIQRAVGGRRPALSLKAWLAQQRAARSKSAAVFAAGLGRVAATSGSQRHQSWQIAGAFQTVIAMPKGGDGQGGDESVF
jgi:hypothetical protein